MLLDFLNWIGLPESWSWTILVLLVSSGSSCIREASMRAAVCVRPKSSGLRASVERYQGQGMPCFTIESGTNGMILAEVVVVARGNTTEWIS